MKFTRNSASILWEDILVDPDVHKNFELFDNRFETIYNESFPVVTKTISSKRNGKPWLSSGLLTSIKNRNIMFKNVKIGYASEERYKIYKSKLVNLLKFAKIRYYTNLFNSFKTNTKKIWHAINNLTNKTTKHTRIENLVIKSLLTQVLL